MRYFIVIGLTVCCLSPLGGCAVVTATATVASIGVSAATTAGSLAVSGATTAGSIAASGASAAVSAARSSNKEPEPPQPER